MPASSMRTNKATNPYTPTVASNAMSDTDAIWTGSAASITCPKARMTISTDKMKSTVTAERMRWASLGTSSDLWACREGRT